MAGYNLIVKADSVDEARKYVDENLSIPIVSGSDLGYAEIMVSINADEDLTRPLNDWLTRSRYVERGQPLPKGALVWWQS